MGIVAMKALLSDARKRNYAVGGFNVFNFETLGAVVEVAEELKTPLVLGLPERLFKFVDVDILGVAMVRAAHKSSVPIAVHLDHGHTFEGVMKAMRWGFTSVMFDGSSLAINENIKRTKEIVKIAHALGINVEGELGYLHNHLATVDEVADYVEKTKVDALAVGVGIHDGKQTESIDPVYIEKLTEKVDIPLVMHGGSRAKLTQNEYRSYIKSGIAKINIATDMSLAAGVTLKEELARQPKANYIHLMTAVKKGVKDSVKKYMLYFDCISKVN